ncbi:hypothetical protein JT05_10610 [Desulfosporosinus sp. Tol-M]|nr:hypothetical protein JT05_10610 [Desulfosporosinus sp. Tol-M]
MDNLLARETGCCVMPFMMDLKNRLPKGGFLHNVLTLMTGTAIAQAIPILISPILTRLYTPEDFGLLALYISVVSLISVIVTARYEIAIMLPKQDEDAANLGALSLSIAVIISALTVLIVLFFNVPIAGLLRKPEIAQWLYLVPLAVLAVGIYQIINYWSTRRNLYRRLAAARVTQSVANGSVNLGLGFAHMGVSGLILGHLAGQVLSAGVLVRQAWPDVQKYRSVVRWDRMHRNAQVYQDFPKVNSLQAFVDILQSSGVVFLISSFFGSVVLGFYSFTLRILQAPLGLLGASVSQVFYQKASEVYKNSGDLQGLVKKTILSLAAMALPVFLILALFAPPIFGFIFGEEWWEAGTYAQILVPWLFLNFIVSPISQVPIIVGEQKKNFLFALVGNSLIILSVIYGGIIAHNIKMGFYILSGSISVYYLVVILWIFKISKKKAGI